MKKILSNVLPIVMMFAMIFTLVIPAKAAELTVVRLNQADKGNVPITANGPKPDDLNHNPLSVDGAKVTDENFAFWVLIANSGPSEYADIKFLLPNGTTKVVTFEKPSVTHNQNDHYNIVTPAGYQVLDGYAYYKDNDKNQKFTLSHSYATPNQPKGSLKVTANVVKQHEKVTYQPVWQKEIQPVWQKEIQPIWQKEIQPIWQKEIQPVWQKEIQPVWQREIQPIWQKEIQPIRQRELLPYNAPTFKKGITTATQGTLVTRLKYTSESIDAVPDKEYGGAFGNGQTYVKLDVAKASAPGGVWYTIADSSPNNGKKTPNQYNIPIDYKYNVQITNGKLTISLDNRLISASVGAYVVNAASDFPGNAPKHTPNTVTVDMPKNFGAYVYLYTHFEGGIKWYTTGEYEFAGWVNDHTDTKDNFVRNDVAKDYFVRNDVAKDYFVRNDVAKDYFVRNDVAKDYFVQNDVAKDYFVRDVVAKDYFVRNNVKDYFVRDDKVGTETLVDQYNVKFNLVVTSNSDGQIVYDGQIANLGEVNISNLNSGDYTAALSGGDIATQTKTVTVSAPNQAVVAFDDVPTVIGEVENVYLPKTYLEDINLPKTYLKDIILDKTYLEDIILDKTYLKDIILDKTYLEDITLDKTYLKDIILDKTYLEDITLADRYLDDINNAPVNIGNETDPYGSAYDPQGHLVKARRLN